jgi:hypothetical protein
MLLNALRAQMAEFGMAAATGPGHVRELVARLGEPDSLPAMLREALLGLVRLLDAPEREIAAVDKQLLAWHRESEVSRRLANRRAFQGCGRSPVAPWPRGCCNRNGFAADATSRPGLAWCQDRTPRAARSGWERSARKATAICAACW